MRVAIIGQRPAKDVVALENYVANVVELPNDWTPEDTRWQPPDSFFGVVTDTGDIGDIYVDGHFQKPELIIISEVPKIISDRQFYQQLAVLQLITEDDALAAVMTGTIPPALQALVDVLPTEQQFSAKMLLSGAVEFQRQHPLTLAFGQALGWTSEQLDQLWTDASKL